MTDVAVKSFNPATRQSPHELPDSPAPASLWRGILLVEPDITLLAAEALLLTRSNYCVTSAFSQGEVFTLRDTKAVALAILSDCLGPRLLTAVATTVRKQWPLARILVLGRAESVLEDYLYDEQIDHYLDPKQLVEDLERLYKGSWNERLNTLDWDVQRSGPRAAVSPKRKSDPATNPAVAIIERKRLRGAYQLVETKVDVRPRIPSGQHRLDESGVPKGSDIEGRECNTREVDSEV